MIQPTHTALVHFLAPNQCITKSTSELLKAVTKPLLLPRPVSPPGPLHTHTLLPSWPGLSTLIILDTNSASSTFYTVLRGVNGLLLFPQADLLSGVAYVKGQDSAGLPLNTREESNSLLLFSQTGLAGRRRIVYWQELNQEVTEKSLQLTTAGMEPSPDWSPPSWRLRSKTKLQPRDRKEWPQFSWWFNRQFMQHAKPTPSPQPIPPTPIGLSPPIHHSTSLDWHTLCSSRFKGCTTDPNKIREAADALPTVDSHTPVSWSTSDGKMIAYYFPQALHHIEPDVQGRPDLVKLGFDSIQQLLNSHKPATQKADRKRYGEVVAAMEPKEWAAYKKAMIAKLGGWGRYIFGLWHATGQTHKGPTMAADECGTAGRAMAVQEWYPAFAPIYQAIGRIFQEADPWAYHYYRANYDYWARKYRFVQSHYVSARCCFMSTAILINQHVLPHRDGKDVADGWVAMTVFGNFTGGYLGLPDLGVKVPFQPGDVILFRSALLEHYVTEFRGTRYSVVFFTKETVVPEGGPFKFDDQMSVAERDRAERRVGVKTGTKNGRKRRAKKEKARRREFAQLDEDLDGMNL